MGTIINILICIIVIYTVVRIITMLAPGGYKTHEEKQDTKGKTNTIRKFTKTIKRIVFPIGIIFLFLGVLVILLCMAYGLDETMSHLIEPIR